MKLVPMLSGVAMAVALSACADKSADVAVPTATPNGINTLSQQAIRQPNVSVPSGSNRKSLCRRTRF